MAKGINKVILVGNLGGDPEFGAIPVSNRPVVKFSIATSESWKDKVTGEPRENTEWHNLVAFDRLAEICNQYLKKGSKVYVEGKLRTRKWQDKTSGENRYMTEIVIKEMQMLDNKNGAAAAPAPVHQQSPSSPPPEHQHNDDIPW